MFFKNYPKMIKFSWSIDLKRVRDREREVGQNKKKIFLILINLRLSFVFLPPPFWLIAGLSLTGGWLALTSQMFLESSKLIFSLTRSPCPGPLSDHIALCKWKRWGKRHQTVPSWIQIYHSSLLRLVLSWLYELKAWIARFYVFMAWERL